LREKLSGWKKKLPLQDAQKVHGSHPPTPARQDAPFREQGRSE
jgi:hypothetical protein